MQIHSLSEEDKSHIGRIISYLESFKDYNTPHIKPIEKEISWLKSLKDRVQPNEEWCKEDEEMIKDIACNLERMANGIISILPSTAVKYAERLKSLKPNHWKPSDLQLEALESAYKQLPNIQYFLHSLYNDLKNL